MMLTTSNPVSQSDLSTVLFFPFIAPPNGGKGTQTSLLATRYGMPRVDMGSLLRAIAKEDSPLGLTVQERLAQGQLVDIGIVIDVLKDGIEKQLNLNTPKANEPLGFILDGFPRNVEQTEALMAMCEANGAKMAAAIYLNVPNETIVERAANRRICADCGAIYNLASKRPTKAGVCDVCGGVHLDHRSDDQPEKVQLRLASYALETVPVLTYFEARGLLKTINGDASVTAISQELCAVMDSYLAPLSTVV
jgi:adenylate kinase